MRGRYVRQVSTARLKCSSMPGLCKVFLHPRYPFLIRTGSGVGNLSYHDTKITLTALVILPLGRRGIHASYCIRGCLVP